MSTVTAVLFNYLDNVYGQEETVRKLNQMRCRKSFLESYEEELHVDEWKRIKKYIIPNITR